MGKLPFFKLDHYEPMLKVVEGLVNAAKKEAPVLLTLYSPYMLINNMVGAETATPSSRRTPMPTKRHRPDDREPVAVRARVHQGGLDGFYHSTQGGEASAWPTRAYLKPAFGHTISRS